MLDFLINVLRVAPVVSALFIVAAVNTKRQVRVRQTWVPLLAVVFALVALILLYRLNDAVASGVSQTGGGLPFLPANISTSWLYIAENSFVLIAFALIKLLSRPVFSRLFAKGNRVAQLLVARVYSYDTDFDLWFVERRFRRTRDFYRSLYWSSMAVTVLFVAFALTFPGWPGFSAVAFPALATMVIGEFYFSIDGLTKEEYESEVFGEQDAARRIGNYGPLREVLTATFPDRVVADGVHLSSLAATESAYRIGEMTRSHDHASRLAGAYFERLRLEGADVDVNLVAAAAQLMSGNNVLIANPFYNDLTPYLSLPAYRTLLEGQKCLIIAGRDSVAEDLVDWVDQGLADITGIPGLWRVRLLDAVSRDEFDVGVLRFADLHNTELLLNNDGFFEATGLLILAEPALMLATGQLGLEIVLDRCNRESPVTVAAFDANHDGLVDTLSHLMKSNLTEVVASSLPQGASCEVVWQADGPHMHTSILPGVSRYLGVGTEISAVALKYQVDKVHWIGGNSFPVTDMKWIAEQYYAPINQFADMEMSQDALSDSIVAIASPWQLPQRDNYFLVVEDESKNVYETVRQFATRAKRSGFINLISDEYLLRDYMTANRDVFSVDPKAVPSVVPDYTRTERNVILRLLLMLQSFGLTESELASELNMLTWTTPAHYPNGTTVEGGDWESPTLRQLRLAIGHHTECWSAPISAVGPGHQVALSTSEEPHYFLENGSALDGTLAGLGPAYFFVEDDADGVNVIGSMLLGHVYQAMLPGVFVSYAGKNYEVQSIHGSTDRPRVILRRAADHIRDRRAYRQLRRYSISGVEHPDTVTATRRFGSVQVRRVTADITAESLGYIESDRRSGLGDGRRVKVHGVPLRTYRRKDLLEIDLSGTSDSVRRTVAVLLNEALVTVFPHGSPFITVLTEDDSGTVGDLLHQLTPVGADAGPGDPSRQSLYVLEDSMIDLGLTSAVERNWEQLFRVVTDYLAWNLTEESHTEEHRDTSPLKDPAALFPERPVIAANSESRFIARVLEQLRTMVSRRGGDTTATPPTRVTPSPSIPIVATEPTDESGVDANDQVIDPIASDVGVEFNQDAHAEATETPDVEPSGGAPDEAPTDIVDQEPELPPPSHEMSDHATTEEERRSDDA
jgi:hypothetical protein